MDKDILIQGLFGNMADFAYDIIEEIPFVRLNEWENCDSYPLRNSFGEVISSNYCSHRGAAMSDEIEGEEDGWGYFDTKSF